MSWHLLRNTLPIATSPSRSVSVSAPSVSEWRCASGSADAPRAVCDDRDAFGASLCRVPGTHIAKRLADFRCGRPALDEIVGPRPYDRDGYAPWAHGDRPLRDTRSFSGTTPRGPTTTTKWPGNGACPITVKISSSPSKGVALFRRQTGKRLFESGRKFPKTNPSAMMLSDQAWLADRLESEVNRMVATLLTLLSLMIETAGQSLAPWSSNHHPADVAKAGNARVDRAAGRIHCDSGRNHGRPQLSVAPGRLAAVPAKLGIQPLCHHGERGPDRFGQSLAIERP